MYESRQLTRSYWERDTSKPVLDLSLGDLLRCVASEVPDRIALVDGAGEPGTRRRWSYRSLMTTATTVASALASHFLPGERIAIWIPNCIEWVFLQYGAAMAGLIIVPINPALLADELRNVLQISQAVAIFFSPRFRSRDMAEVLYEIRAELPDLRCEISLDRWDEFMSWGESSAVLPNVMSDDVAQIQFTSGTTGTPKGACLHHRGIVNAARFVAQRAGVADAGVWVNAMPLFHTGGSGVATVGVLAQRGTLVLMPGFDAARLLELIESERGTVTLLVPTMVIALLEHADRHHRDLSSLQTILSGGAPVPEALAKRAGKDFGCRFSILYGQTELHGAITQTTVDDARAGQLATVGQPLPHMELKIADPITGEPLPLDTPGEICARGYQVMTGYLQDAGERDKATLSVEGWLHTGDVGTMDRNGHVSITGRLKEMIIRGGENIYPIEIERVLLAHPGIRQACVIGLPDAKWGEIVAAVLQLVPEAFLGTPLDTAQQMQTYCHARLAAFKTPTVWYFVEDWPQTATGKIERRRLGTQLVSGVNRGFVVSGTR
ncbi:class I adenylate-forming enzyme family protein [Burkholderia seminalis]|uniref:AMP-binding protein n=1 Tax=Burkholderia seminalis TaxID=488731 RepID=A0A8A8DG26_9BURK|nr:AMP-binding protein [Burkholderia seminalis]QTO23420.1 AMP-binding protein [Burkholderia seminalis]